MRPPLTRSRRRIAPARLGIAAAAIVGALAVAGCDVSEDADTERGRALFQQNCGTCHALAQAGTSAQVGPDLDASFARARADGMDNDTIEGVVQTQIESPRFIREGSENYDRVYMPRRDRHRPGRRGRRHLRRQRRRHPGGEAAAAGAAGAVRREVRHLPRARRRRDQLGHRARSRPGARRQGRRLHRAADRRPELADRPGLLRRGDAGRLRHTLTPQDLKGLVDYLIKSVNGGGGQGG